MGDVISLAERRALKAAAQTAVSGPAGRAVRATFWFDLALPGTYLAAERVDRLFAGVRWQPACMEALHAGMPLRDPRVREAAMAEAEERAAALSVPLVWPDSFGADGRLAMRVATVACELGRGAAFVLAASRLAFCGGFDLSDPEVLAEAAAAASLPLERCIEAAGDASLDGALEEEGRRLLAMGADVLPAIRVNRLLFAGEDRLAEAVVAARNGAEGMHRPAAG
jgi:2-hydroxychromene-2-carboxylate isomerase